YSPHRLHHLAHRNHPRLVLQVDQALGPQGDHHRVRNRVDRDSAHSKAHPHHPEDQVLAMEGLGSSQDQQEDPRKGLNLAREEGRHKGGLEDLDLNSHPTKDLWVDRLHRVGQVDLPLEGLAHLNSQNKTSRLSWGSLFGTVINVLY
uniref:hypothetical protein n=1 Tax=Acidithiobacillus albertensis TaxID=119978 RepID=UPI000A780C9C